jgi:hypothetical protein
MTSCLIGSALVIGSAGTAEAACQLRSPSGTIKHVVKLIFDNVHVRRDNPNVPSDLELQPNLLNFITGKGTMLSNHYTPLISHTATDVITAMAGVYGDRSGIPVGEQLRLFQRGRQRQLQQLVRVLDHAQCRRQGAGNISRLESAVIVPEIWRWGAVSIGSGKHRRNAGHVPDSRRISVANGRLRRRNHWDT